MNERNEARENVHARARGRFQRTVARLSRFRNELAEIYDVELIARTFTRTTVAQGVVPEFLRAVDLNPSQFRDTNVHRNEAPDHSPLAWPAVFYA
jgi:hypothetical protein